jgi:hypothetical protein
VLNKYSSRFFRVVLSGFLLFSIMCSQVVYGAEINETLGRQQEKKLLYWNYSRTTGVLVALISVGGGAYYYRARIVNHGVNFINHLARRVDNMFRKILGKPLPHSETLPAVNDKGNDADSDNDDAAEKSKLSPHAGWVIPPDSSGKTHFDLEATEENLRRKFGALEQELYLELSKEYEQLKQEIEQEEAANRNTVHTDHVSRRNILTDMEEVLSVLYACTQGSQEELAQEDEREQKDAEN